MNMNFCVILISRHLRYCACQTNGDSDHDVIVLKYCHWFLSYYAKNSTVVGVTIFTDSHFVISGDGKQDPSCV